MRKAFVLLLAVGFLASPHARGDDEDPEPRVKIGPELRKLRGKWTGKRRAPRGGKEGATISYEFVGDKVIVTIGDTVSEATAKIDNKVEPPKLMLWREKQGFGTSHVFKIEDDKLYLASAGKGKKAKDGDPFDPKKSWMTVLTREKK